MGKEGPVLSDNQHYSRLPAWVIVKPIEYHSADKLRSQWQLSQRKPLQYTALHTAPTMATATMEPVTRKWQRAPKPKRSGSTCSPRVTARCATCWAAKAPTWPR